MSDNFHLFVYGTLRSGGSASEVLAGCERVGVATVRGTLYEAGSGRFPALMLYGETRVQGEVWRCPVDVLSRIDAYEGVDEGVFRRIGVQVDGIPCWTYVAGPALARELTPVRRILSGDWLARESA